MEKFITFTTLILNNELLRSLLVCLVGVAYIIAWIWSLRRVSRGRRPNFWIAVSAATCAAMILIVFNEARRILGFEPLSPGLMVVFVGWLMVFALIAASVALVFAKKSIRNS